MLTPPNDIEDDELPRLGPDGELPSVEDEMRDLDELLDALEALEKAQQGDAESK
jgi:ribosome assembly protein YihI (activator of Der GTPase)